MKEESDNGHGPLMAEPSGAGFLNDLCVLRGLSNGKEFRMTTSNKGKRSLMREGYMYRLDHSGKDKLSWRCSTRGCPAHLKTDHSADIIVQDNDKAHTHTVDAHKFEKQMLRIACKRKAVEDCSTRTQDIISTEMTRLCGLNLSPKNTKFLQLAMYRERKKIFPKMSRVARSGKTYNHERKIRIPSDKAIRIPSDNASSIPLAIATSISLDNAARIPSNIAASIPQSHIPTLPTAIYSQASSATYQPHFDMLTEDTDSDYHHQHHDGSSIQPHPQHHDGSSIQPHPQQLHQQDQSASTHLHHHQLLHHQLHPLESTLPQTVFPSNHLLPEPMVVALIPDKETAGSHHFSHCQMQTEISHSYLKLHEDLLLDKVRTLTYRRALQENRARLKGTTVLEVGAGTGILSHFALQSGATRVYAVEPTGLAVFADRIARENGVGSAITVIQTSIETADIPVKVDAIICEWMGHSLLCETMLPSLLTARDRYLRQGGDMYPCTTTLYLAPITDGDYQDRLSSWKQMKHLYGVSMESVVALASDALTVQSVRRHLEGESILANACQVGHFDLKTMTLKDTELITADFTFRCYSPNMMHGFATWFQAYFPGSVVLDTSPYALKTHWGQTGLYLKVPVSVQQDSEIRGVFTMQPSAENHSSWDIQVNFQLNRGRKYSQQWQCVNPS